MDMVYGGMAAMLLGWWVGRLFKLSDEDVCVVMLMAGGGSIFSGLAYLFWADATVGKGGNILIWGLVGLVGGVIGVAAYITTRYFDWFIDLAKRNGIL